MSRNLFHVCLYLGLIYMVSAVVFTNVESTSDATTSTGPATTPPLDVAEDSEDSEGLDPVQVLLDAAVAIEENVYNNNPLSSDSISSNPIIESDGNVMEPLV